MTGLSPGESPAQARSSDSFASAESGGRADGPPRRPPVVAVDHRVQVDLPRVARKAELGEVGDPELVRPRGAEGVGAVGCGGRLGGAGDTSPAWELYLRLLRHPATRPSDLRPRHASGVQRPYIIHHVQGKAISSILPGRVRQVSAREHYTSRAAPLVRGRPSCSFCPILNDHGAQEAATIRTASW